MNNHCTDEGLELYAMGQLDDVSTPALEEHILLCEGCRIRLDEADRYVHAMRGAALRLREEAAQKRDWRPAFAWNNWFSVPALGVAAAALFVALFAVTQFRDFRTATPVTTESLFAHRGVVTAVPAHHRLDLKLDTRGLNLGSTVDVTLVNSDGKMLEHFTAQRNGDFAEIRSAHAFSAGNFFVRLYANGSQEELREYAIQVK